MLEITLQGKAAMSRTLLVLKVGAVDVCDSWKMYMCTKRVCFLSDLNFSPTPALYRPVSPPSLPLPCSSRFPLFSSSIAC